eukprot:scaffold44905_cov183-Amphora_coffeaeformis.AAC.1
MNLWAHRQGGWREVGERSCALDRFFFRTLSLLQKKIRIRTPDRPQCAKHMLRLFRTPDRPQCAKHMLRQSVTIIDDERGLMVVGDMIYLDDDVLPVPPDRSTAVAYQIESA